jgi:hypothetical protein
MTLRYTHHPHNPNALPYVSKPSVPKKPKPVAPQSVPKMVMLVKKAVDFFVKSPSVRKES